MLSLQTLTSIVEYVYDPGFSSHSLLSGTASRVPVLKDVSQSGTAAETLGKMAPSRTHNVITRQVAASPVNERLVLGLGVAMVICLLPLHCLAAWFGSRLI